MKYLIAGLGNIGEEYKHTRHNIGFDVVDAFAARHNAVFQNDRLADVAECKWKGKTFILIKPTTYMNLSGRAVKYWLDKEKIPLENLLVILDDLALPLDVIRLRPGGSDAGHNGLKSIQESLGSNQYPRLRFGVGNQYPKGRQVEFVLGKWKNTEEPVVQEKIEKSADIIESFASIGIARTMNEYNKLTFPLGK
ncbi:peptidyl-tRNA hydrolase, PTH1 family [Chitinophaga terrae (ex Kim and Jung 2007)]|uniref:Peptidyl-tRNA hydrolase n=1 Tax=Chitinophaga terrae (ex Kim and Jung 2007) TaxID=408074 RepID=A0A1H4FL71_9BACT|nr:aminoacyl-tRNA hydrolase [Chitinophaga terrae (ex Kim and Jung 2007)]MDQ0105891.1 PTH1 family peptidyl-tRNA hydrolase [Chitinophaga terrae (ex Kim and Jung 2007)]GEP92448.1 peptidyl-tRNA hydrolase [Chitinophaga terrae (ex Kim and Jung 2007)]SEA97560.1 peptidyl-tRNA hydrolase, PTH1 family [Chitinophaga terrae (ex Kim and Jung 2007)]